MKVVMESPSHDAEPSSGPGGKAEKTEAIQQELERILASRFFRSAGRSRQFLQYVVQHKLEGHAELLKERTIGTEVFQRPVGYATGDDPVVRVQAGEVRRRLEQFYQLNSADSTVIIELPVGSYSPVFRWPSAEAHAVQEPLHLAVSVPVAEANVALAQAASRTKARLWLVAGVCLIMLAAAGTWFLLQRGAVPAKSVTEEFWSPIFATQQPVLICLAKPVSYRPTQELYERYAKTHPGTFQTEAERSNLPLPLDPDEKLTWGDMYIYPNYGVALGDVYAAVSFSGLLGKMGKPSQVRIGTNTSFEDLRNSPAVVVGAFNNRWAMHLTSNLHFGFEEGDEQYVIREHVAGGRMWKPQFNKKGEVTEDYAIVARLLDSKTGQFVVTAAGINGMGTQAAAELISKPEYLQEAVRNAPADWQTRNMQILLQTSITDSIPGPPHVVATYFW